MISRHCGNFRVGGRSSSLAVATFSLLTLPAHAMDIKIIGGQLILSGPVVAGDYDAVASRLSFATANKDRHPAKLARRRCADRLSSG
jgi:hypothetical protein